MSKLRLCLKANPSTNLPMLCVLERGHQGPHSGGFDLPGWTWRLTVADERDTLP